MTQVRHQSGPICRRRGVHTGWRLHSPSKCRQPQAKLDGLDTLNTAMPI